MAASTQEYYDAALKLLPDTLDTPVVVFSDDIPWCENNLLAGSNVRCVRMGLSVHLSMGLAQLTMMNRQWIGSTCSLWGCVNTTFYPTARIRGGEHS